jgi:putative phosphoribosyl transferase
VAELESLADEVVCPLTPGNLMAVGQGYDDFRQVEDGEVVEVLERAARPAPDG